MKNMYLIIILLLVMSFLLFPLLAVKINTDNQVLGTSSEVKSQNQSYKTDNLNELKLYLKDEKKTVTLSKEEYLLGVLAAEMSADNHIEALKAQALVAFTYAYHKHIQNKNSGNDYDLTNDTTLDQGYLDKKGREAKWGEKYSQNEEKIIKLIKEIDKELIVYEDNPILAAYHAISAGNTETALNVWGTDYPYLQNENSVCDLLSPDYMSEVTVTQEDFIKKIFGEQTEINIDSTNCIGEIKKSESGTVLSIMINNNKFSGIKLREIFNLRSAAFDVVFKNGNFVFTVYGYGHSVGMSQFGANYLAQQGSGYKEIIKTYYRGVNIIKLE